jgi:hypothetical protein
MSSEIIYKFIPEGAVPEQITTNCFYVNVGSIDHPCVFDHRAGKYDTPGEAVWQAREAILDHRQQHAQVVIVTHQQPNWNSCWAACLLEWLLEGRELAEEKIAAISRFSSFILDGFNPVKGGIEQSAIAVFENLMATAEEAGAEPEKRDLQKIRTSKEFFQFCYDAISSYADLKSGSFFTEDGPYGRAILTIREDYQTYLHDLQKAYCFTALLPRKSGQQERVDGLRMGPPISRLFKFWARSDTEHSTFKAGFPLLVVQREPNRWIISVNPASGYSLDGLGDYLTAEENKLVPPDKSQPDRPGYTCPNPWYDARNTPSAHTIVDSPRDGTKISLKKVEKLLHRFFKAKRKRPAIEKPSWLKDTFIPYVAPVLSLLTIFVVGWILWGQMNQGCDQMANLPELAIDKGKHIAIVIGVNDYDDDSDWPDLTTPIHDASEVMSILTSKYRFSKQDSDEGSILMITGGKLPPTFANIKNTILTTAEKLGTDDSLLIYFAGHGEGNRNDTFGRWIPADGDSKVKCIENSWLQRVIEKCKARHILIVADSCYAGKLFNNGGTRGKVVKWGVKIKAKPSDDLQAVYNLASRQGLTSGNLAPVPDGVGHSPFADAMLNALNRNKNHFLTARMLHSEIDQILTEEEFVQKPYLYVIDEACDHQGEFVFRKK